MEIIIYSWASCIIYYHTSDCKSGFLQVILLPMGSLCLVVLLTLISYMTAHFAHCLFRWASAKVIPRSSCVCVCTYQLLQSKQRRLMWLSSFPQCPLRLYCWERLSHTSPSGRAPFEMSITAGTPIFLAALGDDPLWAISWKVSDGWFLLSIFEITLVSVLPCFLKARINRSAHSVPLHTCHYIPLVLLRIFYTALFSH